MEYVQDKMEYVHVKMIWNVPNPNLKQEAIDLARNSDLVILCMGLSPLLEGEEMKVNIEGFADGDCLDIKLPSV